MHVEKLTPIGVKCHKHTERHLIINYHNGTQPQYHYLID